MKTETEHDILLRHYEEALEEQAAQGGGRGFMKAADYRAIKALKDLMEYEKKHTRETK